jgi:hypothetical protein
MNPAYSQVRFKAMLHLGGLPECFGIVTAWNPDGETQSETLNEARSLHLRLVLNAARLKHFSVTGGSPDFSHSEPGFGIVAEKETIMDLGREFRQQAVFWVERGVVNLLSCTDNPPQVVGTWSALATGDAAQPKFYFRGPISILDAPATAFFCSTQCPGEAVLEAYTWARQQCDEGSAVISGFHTPVEQDVLAILARRKARIIWVPARDLPKKLPQVMERPFAENRLLILSPFSYGQPSRATKESCAQRNRFIARRSRQHYLAHVAEGSSLSADLKLPSRSS